MLYADAPVVGEPLEGGDDYEKKKKKKKKEDAGGAVGSGEWDGG